MAAKRTRWKGSLLLLACALALAAPKESWAEGGDRLGKLRHVFTAQPRQAPPPKPAPRRLPDKARKQIGARPAAAIPAAGREAVRKAAAARIVVVIGDAFGTALARGLSQAFAANPSVRVLDRTSAATGLVRGGAEAWKTSLRGEKGAGRPAALVVMLGGNDRRRMVREGRRVVLLGAGWKALYRERAEALTAAAASAEVPLVWIGLPPVRDREASLAFLAFNEIFREAASETGTFVDTWDGFADEAGAFTARGPDVNGASQQLRSRDGQGFTAAGARLLAFFAERPLAKLVAAPLPAAASALPDKDGPVELLGAPGAPAVPPSPDAQPLPGVRAPAGRADDFSARP